MGVHLMLVAHTDAPAVDLLAVELHNNNGLVLQKLEVDQLHLARVQDGLLAIEILCVVLHIMSELCPAHT